MGFKNKVKLLFEERQELTVVEIVAELNISKQYVHKILNELLLLNFITKIGSTPKTIYRIKELQVETNVPKLIISNEKQNFLKDNFLLITEIGQMLEGLEAFENWCTKRKLPVEKTIDEFILTKEKYNNYLDANKLISGLDKLKNTKGYDEIFLDELLYLDFYAIERFGKTRLGTILHYAKQGQNKMLMRILINEIREKIDIIINEYDINAVAFVPPTIKRETQLMKFLSTGLKINLPVLQIVKVGGIIPVPQKSLNKLEERINNAENTFVIKGNVSYKNLLLIDDAVGSGATLNQISGKIKRKKLAENIIALAIVGSFKEFDVITDL